MKNIILAEALNSRVLRSIGDIFKDEPFDPDSLNQPWAIAVLTIFLVALVMVVVVTALFVYKHKKARKYLDKHKNEIFYAIYEADESQIRLIRQDEFTSDIVMSLQEFIEKFASNKEPKNARLLSQWFTDIMDKKKKSPLFIYATAYRPLKAQEAEEEPKKPKIKDYFIRPRPQRKALVINVTELEYDKNCAHLTIRVLPNVTNDLNRKKRHILSYAEYLKCFRTYLNKNKRSCFTYVSLEENPRAQFTPTLVEEKELTAQLLVDQLAADLNAHSYLIRIDSLQMMFVNLKPEDDETYRKQTKKIEDDVTIFLASNGMDDRYTPLVGQTIHPGRNRIEALARYVQLSSQAAFTHHSATDDKSEEETSDKWLTTIDKAVKNHSWRAYFTPYFELKTGKPWMYMLKLDPYLSSGPITANKFLEEVRKAHQMNKLLDDIASLVQIRCRYLKRKSGTPLTPRIVVPCRLSFCEDVLKSSLAAKDSGFEFILGFYAGEIERYGGPKFDELLDRAKKQGITLALILPNRTPAIDDDTMGRFNLFIVKARQSGEENSTEESLSPVRDNKAAADTLGVLNYLQTYNQPIALADLKKADECYFALVNNLRCVASAALSKESSQMEVLDIEGLDVIRRVNAKHPLWR